LDILKWKKTQGMDLFVVQNSLKLNPTKLVNLNHMLFNRRAASIGGKCTIVEKLKTKHRGSESNVK